MAIKIVCDNCGNDINIEKTSSSVVTNSIRLIYVNKAPVTYTNVCDCCINTIEMSLANIRNKKLSDNETIRQYVYKYSGQGTQKITGIKKLRELTGIGLKEAKDMYELWDETIWSLKG